MITIIKQENGILTTDSREVAEMIGKRHDHLIRDIKGYIGHMEVSPDLGSADLKIKASDFFIESNYKDASGKENKCYLLTRKGCDMVANKMTGKKGVLFTATYVTKFEEMEKEIMTVMDSYRIADPVKRAQKWIEEEQIRIELSEKVEIMTPKAEVYDIAMSSDSLLSMGEVAKIINKEGVGRTKLFAILRNKKILMNDNIPYQKYVDRGYFKVIDNVVNEKTISTTKVTQQGLSYIAKLIK